MRLGLYTNSNEHGDFVANALENLAVNGCNIYIAVAFFTEASIVEQFVEKGCRVRVVVRLGFPTDPDALARLLKATEVEVRFFTDRSFHPKLYLFGTQSALVGSANLTQAAVRSNQEIVVTIGSDDPRLPELATQFASYWDEANVLTYDILKEYRSIWSKYKSISLDQYKFEKDVLDRIGRIVGGNITRNKRNESKESVFLEDFRKTYQECVSGFKVVRRVYEQYGKRKVTAASIPLRLEIDSFISFVRERHATTETWMSQPLLAGTQQEQNIQKLVAEWHKTPWPHFEVNIVTKNYPRLTKVFQNAQTVEASTDDELFDALSVAHSFFDRLRFYLGGLPTWKNVFLTANKPEKVRDSLAYLIFGKGRTEKRMANLIFNPTYKLNEFGQSNVQELIGWCNDEELPIINARTTKVLRYFGFNVNQL